MIVYASDFSDYLHDNGWNEYEYLVEAIKHLPCADTATLIVDYFELSDDEQADLGSFIYEQTELRVNGVDFDSWYNNRGEDE